MSYFGLFYLDKEKDIVVTLDMESGVLSYEIKTPNHSTGNFITNLSRLIRLPIEEDKEGYKVIRGTIPSYINGDNRIVYILRLGNIKVANIYPNGTIERKAYIPAISKTLMSQTKNCELDISKTLIKTYIPTEVKFRSDLHTHRSANLSPDILIALGIHHQISYPYYYIKKLGLRITEKQKTMLENQRSIVAIRYINSGLEGKYLDRKIDDNTEINFADLILHNIENSSYNIAKIRNSLAVMKDGQAVFTNLEKVYLYRYVFTKAKKAGYEVKYLNVDRINDTDIVETLKQMEVDRKEPCYAKNTLYQDKLLWTARSYARVGVKYAEISDTALVKESEVIETLRQIHEIMPSITEETGVVLRFLAAFRRIPLTIVKDQVDRSNYFIENLQVLKAVAEDPYIAGCDFVGEEINDIRELKDVIARVVEIAQDVPGFVVRIHAGENDSLPDNVINSIICAEEALGEGQKFPRMRIGHGLYTAKLSSKKGQKLLEKLKSRKVVLEFQITSNVRLNNLSEMKNHPLKQYLKNDIACVQGTDGGALYGTDSMDEELSLQHMLDLTFDELLKMKKTETQIINESMEFYEKKTILFTKNIGVKSLQSYYEKKILEAREDFLDEKPGERKYDSKTELSSLIKEIPTNKVPIVLVGGSFNNASHITRMQDTEKKLIEELINKADEKEVFFVIGPSLRGYEGYLIEKARNKFDIFAYVPSTITKQELAKYKKLEKENVKVRVSIEASPNGIYKSIAFEIFKRMENMIIALDGNSSAANLIQDAKNSKYESRRFINSRSRGLEAKADSLQGYVTIWNGRNNADIMRELKKLVAKMPSI